jgi:hypothetical protein
LAGFRAVRHSQVNIRYVIRRSFGRAFYRDRPSRRRYADPPVRLIRMELKRWCSKVSRQVGRPYRRAYASVADREPMASYGDVNRAWTHCESFTLPFLSHSREGWRV